MPKTLRFALALLVWAAWPTPREYRQTRSRPTAAVEGPPAVGSRPQDSMRKEATQVSDRRSTDATGQSEAKPPTRAHAEATIAVHSSEAKPFDQTEGPALVEISLSETFTGDIEGESTVRALEIRRNNQSASLISMQRFGGKLGGRQGTFVLQGSETVEHGKITATWFVVPGSGTGGLSGLRGTGGFEGDFGKGSRGTLDYWFE